MVTETRSEFVLRSLVMSPNATPGAGGVRRVHQVDVKTTYTVSTASGGSGKRVGELLISNFAIAG